MEECMSKTTDLLIRWRNETQTPNYNPIPTLIELCELFEEEIKNYTMKHQDPTDERHPSEIDPTGALNQMYMILFDETDFVDKLVMVYLKENDWPTNDLNVAACRLITNLIHHNVIPHLETPDVLKNHELIDSLFSWSENTSEPLKTYATRILASCMELQLIYDELKERNNKLVPFILDRLHSYYIQFCEKNEINQSTQLYQNTNSDQSNDYTGAPSLKTRKREKNGICNSSSIESKGSNWIQIYPPTLATKLVYCLKYLVSIGKNQEFLSHASLKYLAVLLCHEKIATKFIDAQGLQKLLLIPKSSILSNGVSICFNYLSYCEDAMERICLLSQPVLIDLVKYGLWMLECSSDASRCHATMFFNYSFHFRVIQEIFDSHDGLRKMFNVAITAPLLLSQCTESSFDSTKYSPRQIYRCVCAGFKHYFEAHLYIKAQKLRREKIGDSVQIIPSTKSTKQPRAKVQEDIELLSNGLSLEDHWTPIDQFLKLDGLSFLLKIISVARKGNFFVTCGVIKNALEVLNICAVLPKVQLALCKIPSHFEVPQNGISIVEEDDSQTYYINCGLDLLIKAAKGDHFDAGIQKAALSVIITCVCTEIHREGNEAVIEKSWDCIKKKDGIMVLLNLITIQTPIDDADAIRGLASCALAGLARSESVRQIFSKLPLFSSGELQSLMKNPVKQVNLQEHATFQKYGSKLIELVSGKTISYGVEIETSLATINWANVVAQTKINFYEQQLNLLMYQHLMEKGYFTTAKSFVQDANLNIAENKSYCHNWSIGGEIFPISSRTIQNQKSELANLSNGPLGSEYSAKRIFGISLANVSIVFNLSRRSENHPKLESEQELKSPISKSVHKKINQDLTLLTGNGTNSKVSLKSIVTEYLTNQHASCKHPMVTCPQFNLFLPHKCPGPNPRSSMLKNFAMRFSKNIHSRKLNQRLIHSRFCPTRCFTLDDEYSNLTCCEFLSHNRIAIGTAYGKIRVFNLFTSQEELSFLAHEYDIKYLQCSNDERILLSSATWGRSLTSVWSITENTINTKYSLDNEKYCTFSNYDQNKILGTREKIATIYDLETSKRILSLVPRYSNEYRRNQAVFDATNKLVLSDGVLWDALAGKEIHKFVKMNEFVSGIFHPNGLEIISNTEVWDIRTFQLLRTVSSLNQCDVIFSKSGDGMYAFYNKDKEIKWSDKTSFKTLDPNDYSTTIDVEESIYHMACNSSDTQIAIVEYLGAPANINDSIVQLYDVGRSRTKDEAVEKEDDDLKNYMFCKYFDHLFLCLEMIAGGMEADEINDHFSSGNCRNSSL
ncbi:DDB1- and CUL4-associated factor 1-like [Acyrthosiphon pisum]|uniref:LisH domain-containing protein n=1 Tax=Acyrthosiphon pisum TaxID=7029 RepID=A0A8R2JT39_ACYPI|nr:DDB1- and CUL4-associated factor 1-like [Acyrthosiphon pisum]